MAKILVVDDEKVMVKGIRFNLENEGYTVDVGYNGRQAVDLARANDYDLIILDLMMPELDGLEACMEIRSFSSVPIIMLTARSQDTDKLLGFEYGADDYITKPFNILEVKARVKALLRRSAATRLPTVSTGRTPATGLRLPPRTSRLSGEEKRAGDGRQSELVLSRSSWICWNGFRFSVSAQGGDRIDE